MSESTIPVVDLLGDPVYPTGERRERDFYPTPAYCVHELLTELDQISMSCMSFHEPCYGDGAIYDLIPAARKTWTELEKGLNFFAEPCQADMHISNPPFSIWEEFLEKSWHEARFVAYLLRVNSLGAQKRFEFWQHRIPSHFFVMSNRPDFSGDGGDSTEYAWYVWDGLGLCKRKPGIHVIWNTRGMKF